MSISLNDDADVDGDVHTYDDLVLVLVSRDSPDM